MFIHNSLHTACNIRLLVQCYWTETSYENLQLQTLYELFQDNSSRHQSSWMNRHRHLGYQNPQLSAPAKIVTAKSNQKHKKTVKACRLMTYDTSTWKCSNKLLALCTTLCYVVYTTVCWQNIHQFITRDIAEQISTVIHQAINLKKNGISSWPAFVATYYL